VRDKKCLREEERLDWKEERVCVRERERERKKERDNERDR
jgi:hypothetical protein